jgi:hypothetical protein
LGKQLMTKEKKEDQPKEKEEKDKYTNKPGGRK